MSGAEWIDLGALRSMAEGCGWTLAELARRYLGDAETENRRLADALEHGDAAEAARLAHGWAGGSEMAGVPGLASILRAVERAARAGDLDAARTHARAAARGLDDVRRELASVTNVA